jgi:hypothetical protein
MIYKKSWIKRMDLGCIFYVYTGYFLFGIVPLYIKRERAR